MNVGKNVRAFNTNEKTTTIIKDNAPSGRGFSKWINDQIEEAEFVRNNPIITKSKVKNIGVEI